MWLKLLPITCRCLVCIAEFNHQIVHVSLVSVMFKYSFVTLVVFLFVVVPGVQYAPFKPGSKRTLAERARQLGLDGVLDTVLMTGSSAALSRAVNASIEGYSQLYVAVYICSYLHLVSVVNGFCMSVILSVCLRCVICPSSSSTICRL